MSGLEKPQILGLGKRSVIPRQGSKLLSVSSTSKPSLGTLRVTYRSFLLLRLLLHPLRQLRLSRERELTGTASSNTNPFLRSAN
jgi:hypothetical protein